MKKLYAGIVNDNVEFYQQDPTGHVDGLQSSRPFAISGDGQLTDWNGADIVTEVATQTQSQQQGQQN